MNRPYKGPETCRERSLWASSSSVCRRICHSLLLFLLLSVDKLLLLDVWCNWHFDKMNSPQVALREGGLMSQSAGLSRQRFQTGPQCRETQTDREREMMKHTWLWFVCESGDVVKGWICFKTKKSFHYRKSDTRPVSDASCWTRWRPSFRARLIIALLTDTVAHWWVMLCASVFLASNNFCQMINLLLIQKGGY